MYESFYGFREKPFSLVPDPEFLYLSRRHQGALNMLELALARQAGISLITGEVGSGKTTVIRSFLRMLDANTTVGLITNIHPEIDNLLKWILWAFDLDYKTKDKVELYDRFIEFLIKQYAANHHTVLIIDEAQNLDVKTLEELRVLSNVYDDKEHVLQIIFIGQPELLKTLNRPELKQLAQRIAVNFHIGPLTFKETAAYIRHRLKVAGGDRELFDDMACAAVHYFSKGVPRLINILCDFTLIYGYAEEKPRLDFDTVLSAVKDRKEGGLNVFTGDRGTMDRAKILAELSELSAEATSEKTSPEYNDTGLESEQAISDRPAPPQNDSLGQDMAPDALGNSGQSPEMPAPEQQGSETTFAQPLKIDTVAEVTELQKGSKRKRRRARALPWLAFIAILMIGLVTPPSGLFEHELVSNFMDPKSREEHQAPAPASTDLIAKPDVAETPAEPPPNAVNEKAIENRATDQLEKIATAETITTALGVNAPDPSDGNRPPPSKTLVARSATETAAKAWKPFEEISLDELLQLPDHSTNIESAAVALFDIWNIDYAELNGSDLCEKAAQSGLACLQGKASLAHIRNLNRPALITLPGPDGIRLYAVISSLDGSAITVRVGERRIVSNVGRIAFLWSGEYVILWKPPPLYSHLLQEGLDGPTVAWVKNRLAMINATPTVPPDYAVFDSELRDEVIAFQRSRRLQPDGIIGPRTLIHLNTAAGIQGTPLLLRAESRPSNDS